MNMHVCIAAVRLASDWLQIAIGSSCRQSMFVDRTVTN